MKSYLSITSILNIISFCKFAQSTAVILPCSVQNFKMIGHLRNGLWTNKISRDLSLRRVSEGCPILQQPSGTINAANFLHSFQQNLLTHWHLRDHKWSCNYEQVILFFAAATEPHQRQANTGSANGSVPLGNMPIPEPTINKLFWNLFYWLISSAATEPLWW